jgi:hypothetical protein
MNMTTHLLMICKRVPDVIKSKEILGLECNTSLEVALNQIIHWIEK